MIKWTIDDWIEKHSGETIFLLTPQELENIADGQLLITILGEEAVKGVDIIDDDLRQGYLAFGLPEQAVVHS